MSTKEDLVKAMSTWLKKKEDLPLSFGADSEKVLTGEKSLLSGDDLLNFKCTGNDIRTIKIKQIMKDVEHAAEAIQILLF